MNLWESVVDSPISRIFIVECIFISYIVKAKIHDIFVYLKIVSIDATYYDPKAHLFLLLSGTLITNDVNGGMHSTSRQGQNLLNEMYIQRKDKIVDYSKLAGKVE